MINKNTVKKYNLWKNISHKQWNVWINDWSFIFPTEDLINKRFRDDLRSQKTVSAQNYGAYRAIR